MLTRWLTFAFCLFTSPSLAAVAIESCQVSEPASCTNCDVSFTNTAGNTLALFVGVGGTGTISSATWDFGGSAQAMTPSLAMTGVGTRNAYSYYLVSPATGTKTMRVVFSGNVAAQWVICALTGVNTADPVGTAVENEEAVANGTTQSIAFTNETNGISIGYHQIGNSSGTVTIGADQTDITTNNAFGDDDIGSASWAVISPFNYSWANSTSSTRWLVIIPFKAGSTRRPSPPLHLGY